MLCFLKTWQQIYQLKSLSAVNYSTVKQYPQLLLCLLLLHQKAQSPEHTQRDVNISNLVSLLHYNSVTTNHI